MIEICDENLQSIAKFKPIGNQNNLLSKFNDKNSLMGYPFKLFFAPFA